MTTYTAKFYGSDPMTPRTLAVGVPTREMANEVLLDQLARKMDTMSDTDLLRVGYVHGPAHIIESKRRTLKQIDSNGVSGFYFNGHRYWMTPEPEAKTSKPGELAKAAREYADAAGALEAAFLNEKQAAERLADAISRSRHND